MTVAADRVNAMMRARLRSAAIAAVLLVTLAGCGGAAGADGERDTTPLKALAEQTLGALEGVGSVTVGQTQLGAGAAPSPPGGDAPDAPEMTAPGSSSLPPDEDEYEGPNRSDPDLWAIAIGVSLLETATVEQAVAVTDATWDFSRAHAGEGSWHAHVTLGGGEPNESDLVALPRVQVRAFPAEASPGDSMRAAFAGAAVEGVASVAIGTGWPEVQLVDATAFAPAHTALRELPPFTQGARYATPDGRLILVDVPERITAEALEAIAQVAADHPTADVALEAGYDGPRWPQLYMNRVPDSELDGLLAFLNDPRLADADPEGYPIKYAIRSFTESGSTDTEGALGAVPLQ